ncbi:MAG TPA: pseudouridine synthase [Anaerolineaceae bacterium]|nr:MAG: pseudouridine synthase [Chloroflexi bacterium GWB2_54_36]HAL17830.1 pseudouridine synthase [Anaerolineaceae bacterium]HBA90296.1 pseudouridine synthase [Anaerolineaceae bacterium]
MGQTQASRVLVFYKPYGVLCSFTDSEEQRPTLKDYIPVADVYAAGRLDLDSEGLLLLSNDGDLIHRLTDPQHKVAKTYLVQVEGEVNQVAIAALEQGVEVKGRITQRSQAMLVPEPVLPERDKPVTPHGPTSWVRIVLKEGKKRQIRHMTAAVGFPTLRLVRVSIGNITLEGLIPGQWRDATPVELSRLRELIAAAARRKPGRA